MTDPHNIARDYLALWNDADDASRSARLFDGWSNDASYIDPLMKGEGRDGIATMIAAARTQFPGHAFTLAGTPDGHGNYVRFSWTLAADGPAIAAGTDMVRLDDAGRIVEVVGFLDGAAG